MTKLHSFDPEGLHVIYAGAQIEGWAEDSMVEIEYNEDQWELKVGLDGEAVRSKRNNKSAKIKMMIMPGARSNLVFAAAQSADDIANEGALPLSIVDESTGTTFMAEAAWVMKDPGQKFGKSTDPQEWVLETAALIHVPGTTL
jgi:hypothetical protein